MTSEIPERRPEENRFRWTEHPDAYPDQSHCPSCGEPVDVPWGETDDGHPYGHRPSSPIRCDQCERDLRLPTYAIKDQLCLLCKVPATEAAEEVVYRRLETGERMCSNCASDLRAFKYEFAIKQFIAEWLTDDHREALLEAQAQVSEMFESEYTFTFDANARYGRMEPETDEELTVQDMITGDVDPEDLPDEVRQVVSSSDGDEDEGEDES